MGVISVLNVDYYPSGRVISIKSQLCIPSVENNFPPVASAPAEGTQYAAANFNLSFLKDSCAKISLLLTNSLKWTKTFKIEQNVQLWHFTCYTVHIGYTYIQ